MPAIFSKPGPLRAKEKNFFIISGLPHGYTWRALKDLVRGYTINQPGWTGMDEFSSPYGDGYRRGYFSVKTDEDAANVYHLLINHEFAELADPSHRLLVHHWDVSQTRPVLLKCNCSAIFPAATRHSDSKSQITAQFVNSALYQQLQQVPSPPVYVTMAQPYRAISVAASAPMPIVYATQTHVMPQTTYYHPPPAMTVTAAPPVYSQPGIPVNVSNGAVRTEARGIHIRGLKYSVTEGELKELLEKFGNPLRIELKKGSATVRFGSPAEAGRAIQGLNGVEHKGMRLSVRHDKDRTPISEPVIVNGGPRSSQYASSR